MSRSPERPRSTTEPHRRIDTPSIPGGDRPVAAVARVVTSVMLRCPSRPDALTRDDVGMCCVSMPIYNDGSNRAA
jgi:hypothetical protein